MSINIIINGAQGRMGQITAQTIRNEKDLRLVAEIGRSDDLVTTIHDTNAHIVIDFTSADSVYNNTAAIIKANAKPIVGTSGLVADQVAELQKLAKQYKVAGIIAPNFSLGALLMLKFSATCAHYFSAAEIIEMHHDGKLDSPSGTAIRTSEVIYEHRQKHHDLPPQKETIIGARGANNHSIPIHAVRLPGLVAHQQVMFGARGETLTIRHDSTHRESFMPGVLLACRKVMELDELVYGLENLI